MNLRDHTDLRAGPPPTGRRHFESPGQSGIDASEPLPKALVETFRREGGPALRFHEDGRWTRLSYAELEQRARAWAKGLIALGVEAGDRVAILSRTRAEWTLADLAVMWAGAIVVPVYETNSPEETEHVLRDSGVRVLFAEDEDQLAKVEAVRDRLPELEQVISFTGTQRPAISLSGLTDAGTPVSEDALDERIAAIGADDIFTIVYTSGTTGAPKGVLLTHRNVRANVEMVKRRIHFGGGANTVYLWLPLAHVLARMVQFVALDQGAQLAYWRRDMRRLLDDVADVQPTHVPAVPRLFEKIYDRARSEAAGSRLKQRLLDWAIDVGRRHRLALERGGVPGVLVGAQHLVADRLVLRKIRRPFGSGLKFAVTGAAPIDPEILRFFHAAGVYVLEGYGMTETTAVTAVNSVSDYRFGTVGKPLPGAEVAIADDGELLVRGPHVFAGYRHSEGSELDSEGWLHTGDLASIDADGFVTITGRKKDIIITASGKNVTPASIEAALERSGWISHAVVFGDRRPFLTALIALDPEAPAHARDEIQGVVDEVNSRFARPEQVKRFVILDSNLSVEAGELTPTGKVKRQVVYDRYGHALDALYDEAAATNGATA